MEEICYSHPSFSQLRQAFCEKYTKLRSLNNGKKASEKFNDALHAVYNEYKLSEERPVYTLADFKSEMSKYIRSLKKKAGGLKQKAKSYFQKPDCNLRDAIARQKEIDDELKLCNREEL